MDNDSRRAPKVIAWIPPAKREPLAMLAMGLGILAIGLIGLVASLDAVIDGRQYAGGVSRRNFANRMPADIGVVVMGFMTLGGAGYVTLAISRFIPALAERAWLKTAVGWVFALSLLLLLLASALVVVVRVLR